MIYIKNLFFLIVMILSFLSCRSQTKNDNLLTKKAEGIDTADIRILIKKGYITETDRVLIGSYMIRQDQKKINLRSLTIGQLLDSVKAEKKRLNNFIATSNNFGKDSVFIRSPNGDRNFMGMGALSFEKLVAKESLALPDHYDSDYDLKINSKDAANTLGKLIASDKNGWVTGNVMIVERDNGKITEMRIGDLFEIAKRIIASKEFAPFVNKMN